MDLMDYLRGPVIFEELEEELQRLDNEFKI